MMLGALAITMGQETVLTPYTPYFIDGLDVNGEKTVIFDVLPNGVEGAPEIPKDCQIWTNGCADCEVKDGKVVNCPA